MLCDGGWAGVHPDVVVREVTRVLRWLLPAVAALLLWRVAPAGACASDAECASFGSKCHPGAHFCDANGTCTVPSALDCDDGDVCTDDSCSELVPGNGCSHAPHCPDDGQVCNGTSECVPFHFGTVVIPECLPGTPPNCDDGNACTIDSCVEPTGCTHVAVACDDGNPCTQDLCDVDRGCVHVGITGCCRTSADCGQDACATGVRCVANVCTGGQTASCDDADACTVDTCDPTTGCMHTPIPGCCRTDADCTTSGDSCAGSCGSAHTCDAQAKTGLDAVSCACARAQPAACSGQSVPAGVTRGVQRACALVGGATGVGPKQRRALTRATALLAKAARAVAPPGVGASCAAALKAAIGDLHGRAVALLDTL